MTRVEDHGLKVMINNQYSVGGVIGPTFTFSRVAYNEGTDCIVTTSTVLDKSQLVSSTERMVGYELRTDGVKYTIVKITV